MTMLARWLARAAVLAIAGAVTLGVVLAPAQAASSPRWRVARVFAGPGQDFAVSAAGSGDAWVTGVTGRTGSMSSAGTAAAGSASPRQLTWAGSVSTI